MRTPGRYFVIPELVASLLISALVITCSCPVSSAWAGDQTKCSVCGMDMSKYPHTRYAVMTNDGQKHEACGVQCGLTLHVRLGNKWKSATASDLLSNRPFDVKEGSFVFKSSVITDMAPGFIGFKLRTNAEKFANGFGGEVMRYTEALERWKREKKWPSEGQ
jgi:nitrous oxide reductase accessory protein NosL